MAQHHHGDGRGRSVAARVTIAGETFTTEVASPAEARAWLREQAAQHPRTRIVERDDACHVAPTCLACPLATCVLDRGGSFATGKHWRRDAEIARLFASGVRVRVLVARYGLSRRHIFRILAQQRRACATGGTAAHC